MSNLISRHAAIEKMEALADDDNLTVDEARSLSWCIRAIESLPSAQTFNKGLWVKQELAPRTLRFCSLCGCKKPRGVAGNFCPNCGARMEVEHELHYNECKPD